MQQSIPSPLDELAGKATITIEQTARILGLGRTAAYDAARRGELPTRSRPSCAWRPTSVSYAPTAPARNEARKMRWSSASIISRSA